MAFNTNKDHDDFNQAVKNTTSSLISTIVKHPLIFLISALAIIAGFLILFIVIAIIGAPHSFTESLEETMSTEVTDEGIPVGSMTEDEYNKYISDSEVIYEALKNGKIDLDSLNLAYLDEKSVKRIFTRLHEYEERRKEKSEVTYTYRVETNADPEYENVTEYTKNSEGKLIPKYVWLRCIDKGYQYTDHPMNDVGEIDVDTEQNKHVTYGDREKTTVERSQIEVVIDGERDLMKIDWQPVYALLSTMAVDSYDEWNYDNMVSNNDGTMKLDNFFLTDEQIDAVIDIFYYDDSGKDAYYYDLLDTKQTNFMFLNMIKCTCAFKLQVEETGTQRITKRIPCSAPYLIKNKYRKFLYKYEKVGNAAVSSGGAQDPSQSQDGGDASEDEEEPSGGSNVTIIGDSITNYSRDAIAAKLPNAVIDAANGRTVQLRSPEQEGGLEIAEKLDAAGQLNDIVVFAMGTNNAGPEVNNQPYLSVDMLDQLKSIVGSRRVFLVTNYDMSTAYEEWWKKNNEVIRSYCSKTANWDYIDWASKTSSAYLLDEPDAVHKGVHPNDSGKELFASLIYEAVEPYLDEKAPKKYSTPTGEILRCTEREMTTSGVDFETAVYEIDPKFDWDFFLQCLEPLPNGENFMAEFELLRLDAVSGTDRIESTKDEADCSAIGTILVRGSGTGGSSSGSGGSSGGEAGNGTYTPGMGQIGEVPYDGPKGSIPYYDVYDASHSFTALNKDYVDESGTVYPGVGTYCVDEDAYRGLDRSDGLTVAEIETMLGSNTSRFNPNCALFSSPAALSATAQTLYNCQESMGVSICGMLAIACHECANFGNTKNVNEHWNYFSIAGKGSSNYTGGYHFINYRGDPENGVACSTPQEALGMQIESVARRFVSVDQRNYVTFCWSGNDPNVGRSSIHHSYCPYWEDYAMPASGQIYGKSLTPSGLGWSGAAAARRRELEYSAGISGMTTGVD